MSRLKIKNVDPKRKMPWDSEMYSMEISFGGGGVSETMVAVINHERKTIRPAHGYYPPHKTGKKTKKYAKKIGYEYLDK